MEQNDALRMKARSVELHQMTRVFAVASGKGGVGKTNVVANLAFALTTLQMNVLVMDADLSLGNLDILLGYHGTFVPGV